MRFFNKIKSSANNYDEWQELSNFENTKISNLETIPPDEADEILHKTIIDGDDYIQLDQNTQKEKYYTLSNDFLKWNNMSPIYATKIDNLKIALSRTYKVGTRDAIMAYVCTDNGYKARSYYRSSSQGIWRYLPDYVIDENTKKANYYGKSSEYFDNITVLPFQLQISLNQVAGSTNTHEIDPYGDYMFLGTAKRYSSKQEYREALRTGRMRGDFYREVNSFPSQHIERLNNHTQEFKPEFLVTESFLKPDFSHKIASDTFDTNIYGKITMEEFCSQDNSLNYIFAKDNQSRAWIANIEQKSKLTSTGCYAEWIEAPDLIVPLYEYAKTITGQKYGNFTDRKGSQNQYVCMWENYLSKIPMIYEFLTKRSK